jgi:hypothetical protein
MSSPDTRKAGLTVCLLGSQQQERDEGPDYIAASRLYIDQEVATDWFTVIGSQ